MNTVRNKISFDIRAKLAASTTYREFLQTYFTETELAYAEVARRAGFSSRSYPRDVTEGRRRLTVKSLPTLLRGLRLENDLARFFQLLYFAEHPTEHPDSLSLEAISKRLIQEKLKITRMTLRPARQKSKVPKASARDNNSRLIANGLVDVMAGLGDSQEGATFEEVHERTAIPRTVLRKQIDALIASGAISYRADIGRLVANAEHVDWTESGKVEIAKLACESAIERMSRATQSHFGSDEAMFLNSGFAVAKSDLPRLKKELRDLLLSFIDRSIESTDSTETIVHIVTGLFEGRVAPVKPSYSPE